MRLGFKHTEESKKKISLTTKGKSKSLETRRKMSLVQIGNQKSLGKKMPKSAKIAISNANKGRYRNEEVKKKMSLAQIGKKLSPATKLKMSLSRKGKKFSIEHRNKLSQSKLKEKSHFWKGGVTEINKKIRSSIEYRLWREAVFKRDNWNCVWCGKKGRIEADHIKPFAYFPEFRFAIDNGRTLCRECHKTTDTYGRKYKNDKRTL